MQKERTKADKSSLFRVCCYIRSIPQTFPTKGGEGFVSEPTVYRPLQVDRGLTKIHQVNFRYLFFLNSDIIVFFVLLYTLFTANFVLDLDLDIIRTGQDI